MTQDILNKLLAIFITVAIGWFAGIFVPALLFRTTARLDLHGMPWATVAAFFVPVVGMLLLVYLVQRFTRPAARQADRDASEREAAQPAVRAITVTFGNSVQIGIPLAAGVFYPLLGWQLSPIYAAAAPEAHDAAFAAVSHLPHLLAFAYFTGILQQKESASLWRTLRTTAYNTIVHPVVLPVLAGLVWNLGGLGLPGPVDETLALLGTAVAPVCLVLIGISLAYYGVGQHLAPALGLALLKLVALPALVLCVAHWGFGLRGLPLSVAVVMAALPAGSNALIFSQRYRSQEALTTTTIVLSTFGFVLTVPLWLAVLARLG